MSIQKVLVVDDEIEFAKTLKRHLRREGFDTEIAGDGSDARRIIETAYCGRLSAIDLVITDVIMPNMDGIELLKWIKRNQPQIPVILLTGFGDNHAVAQVVRPGQDGFCKKPITPRRLMELIELLDTPQKQETH